MDRSSLLRLLGDPTRAAILEALVANERAVADLVELTGDEQSNVSHHLRHLREAGLVVARRHGRRQLYRFTDPEVGRLLGELVATASRLEQACYTARLGIPADAGFHGYG
ncbi:MAG TPA: metalloregulator ArsR/SmtB family transcription factor [Candidatus Thermoplasmatota archaeon]|nr:metalloregulator ArsR/SmtB family transcription factor [Candidatus Thermoplasmatota archaeon]